MGWWQDLLRFLGLSRNSDEARQVEIAQFPASDAFVRNADWHDVLKVAALLDKHGVDYTLLGGYALNFNGLVRQTGDVDILVANNPENNRKWIAALSELPDAAASELRNEAADPFPKDEWEDDPGVLRIADEIIVDVMPRACGLELADLRDHVHRVHHHGVPLNVLDLHGLRKTKQGIRPKDVADLRHIDMTLEALKVDQTVSTSGMARRNLVEEPIPTTDRILFVEPPIPTDEEIVAASRLIDRVKSHGGVADVDPNVILSTCDLARIIDLDFHADEIEDLGKVLDGREPDPTLPSSMPRP